MGFVLALISSAAFGLIPLFSLLLLRLGEPGAHPHPAPGTPCRTRA